MASLLLAVAARDERTFLADQLAADGYEVVEAATHGEAVLAAQTERSVGAVVVDLALPDLGGLRLVRELRAGRHVDLNAELPVLALLRDGDAEPDLVRAFSAGADDVQCRPLSYPELRCRLTALLRRASRTDGVARRRRIGELQIDVVARSATVAGAPVVLSQTEFDLLTVLSSDPARVFKKAELLREIWGIEYETTSRTLDSHACRLRARLREAGGEGYVANRWGIGYSLLPPR